jgi:hypothetical protein
MKIPRFFSAIFHTVASGITAPFRRASPSSQAEPEPSSVPKTPALLSADNKSSEERPQPLARPGLKPLVHHFPLFKMTRRNLGRGIARRYGRLRPGFKPGFRSIQFFRPFDFKPLVWSANPSLSPLPSTSRESDVEALRQYLSPRPQPLTGEPEEETGEGRFPESRPSAFTHRLTPQPKQIPRPAPARRTAVEMPAQKGDTLPTSAPHAASANPEKIPAEDVFPTRNTQSNEQAGAPGAVLEKVQLLPAESNLNAAERILTQPEAGMTQAPIPGEEITPDTRIQTELAKTGVKKTNEVKIQPSRELSMARTPESRMIQPGEESHRESLPGQFQPGERVSPTQVPLTEDSRLPESKTGAGGETPIVPSESPPVMRRYLESIQPRRMTARLRSPLPPPGQADREKTPATSKPVQKRSLQGPAGFPSTSEGMREKAPGAVTETRLPEDVPVIQEKAVPPGQVTTLIDEPPSATELGETAAGLYEQHAASDMSVIAAQDRHPTGKLAFTAGPELVPGAPPENTTGQQQPGVSEQTSAAIRKAQPLVLHRSPLVRRKPLGLARPEPYPLQSHHTPVPVHISPVTQRQPELEREGERENIQPESRPERPRGIQRSPMTGIPRPSSAIQAGSSASMEVQAVPEKAQGGGASQPSPPAPDGKPPGVVQKKSQADLEDLARQVYPILRQRLKAEIERSHGGS